MNERVGDMVGDGDKEKRSASARARSARTFGLPFSVLIMVAMGLSLTGCSPLMSASDLTNGTSPVPSHVVQLGISSFLQSQVTIHAGQSVQFEDPPSAGGVHYVCVGTNLHCDPTPGTPAPLATPWGLLFANGQDPVRIRFDTPGVYQVICIIHPGMEMHVIVK